MVQNITNERSLIFWIAITVLDNIANLALYFPLFFDYDYWDNWGDWLFYQYTSGYDIRIAFDLIPKLLSAIPAVYIVIKGLLSGSNQEQTTIEMDNPT